MTDVVDLCSSDEEAAAPTSNSDPLGLLTWSEAAAHGFESCPTNFGDNRDDGDSSEDLFVSPRPTKRRRLNERPSGSASKILKPGLKDHQRMVNSLVANQRDLPSDPIAFTSPAARRDQESCKPRQRSDTVGKPVIVCEDDSENDLPEPNAIVQGTATFSTRTIVVLAEISNKQSQKRPSLKNKRSPENVHGVSNDESATANVSMSTKKPRLSSAERELHVAEKENAKQDRAKAREAEKEKRRLEREAEKEKRKQERELKAQEKQKAADLAEVNRSKIDKKITTPEMIVHLPKSLEGKPVDNKLRELLRHYKAEARTYESEIPGLVKWQQKVSRDFDEEQSHWVRANRIDDNKFILCILSGEQFCNLASGNGEDGEDLEMHLAKIRTVYPDREVIYLIEGLEAWIKRSKSAQNKAYQAAVRRMEEQEQTQSRRRRNNAPVLVDERAVEDALLELQITYRCKIQQTIESTETAEYIASFTSQISLIRHGVVEGDASFCMETGQVQSGKNNEDTYLKMLKQLNRITDKEANGIASHYPNVVSLVRAFKEHGQLALEDIRKLSAAGNDDARIGQAASRRLYKVFMETDPSITIA